jgi:hypothetical protein
MREIFIDYPTNFSFKTRKTFTSNEERTKYLHQVLRKNKVESPCHGYNEYVVEDITWVFAESEFWIIGS